MNESGSVGRTAGRLSQARQRYRTGGERRGRGAEKGGEAEGQGTSLGAGSGFHFRNSFQPGPRTGKETVVKRKAGDRPTGGEEGENKNYF